MPEIGVFPRNESPGFLIYRTAVLLKAGLRRAFQAKGLDVTPEQWSVLGSLWEREGVHQSRLAEKTEKDRHNITRILDLMEKRRLIQRKADRNDKRCQRIYLTEAGKELELELIPIAADFLDQAFDRLTDKDVSALKRILGQIMCNLGHSSADDGTRSGRRGTTDEETELD